MTPREAFTIVWSAVCKGDLSVASGRSAAKGGPSSISALVALLKQDADVWADHLLMDRERCKTTLRNITERGRSEMAKVTAARTLAELLDAEGLNGNTGNTMPTEIIFRTHPRDDK